MEDLEFYPDAAEKSFVLTASAESNVFYFYYSSYKNAKVTVTYTTGERPNIETHTVADNAEIVGGKVTHALPIIVGC